MGSNIKIISLNQLIKMFNDFADNHLQLNDFGFGSTSLISTSKNMQFPYMWITTRNTSVITVQNKTAIPTMSLTFLIVDKINIQRNYEDVNGYNSDNSQEVQSDMLQIAQDLVNYISSNLNQFGVKLVDQSVSAEIVYDETTDKVTGWLVDVDLQLTHNNCSIPGDFVSLNPFPPCTPGFVSVNNDNPQEVASGGSLNIDILNCVGDKIGSPTGSNIFVGNSFVDVNGLEKVIEVCPDPGKTTALFQVKNDDGVLVGTASGMEGNTWVVPTAATSAVCNSAELIKSGQIVSYATNDDGDLQQGSGLDFTTLSWNNPFGDTNRFTDDLGTQVYTNNIYIDWTTYDGDDSVLGYCFGNQVGITPQLWTSWMSGQPYSVGGHNDWYVANMRQLNNVVNYGVTGLLDYSPINFKVINGATIQYSSTTKSNDSTRAFGLYIFNQMDSISKGVFNSSACLVRNYTLAELGL